MSTNAGAILAYGYALGGGEAGWYVNEVRDGSDGMELDLPWLPYDGDRTADETVELMAARLLAEVAGFTESNPMPDGRLVELLDEAGKRSPHPTGSWESRQWAWADIRNHPEYQASTSWSERRNEAIATLGVKITTVGSDEYTEYVLTATGKYVDNGEERDFPITCEWAETRRMDLVLAEDWDSRLAVGVKALGITPIRLVGYPWRDDCERIQLPGPALILGATYR